MHGKQKRQRPDKRIDVCASRRAKTLQVFAIARNELSADSGNIERMINDRVVADARQPIAVGLAPERHEVGKRLRCHGDYYASSVRCTVQVLELLQPTDRRMTYIVGPGDVDQGLARLPPCNRFPTLVVRQFWLAAMPRHAPWRAPCPRWCGCGSIHARIPRGPPSTVSLSRPCGGWCQPSCPSMT